MTADTPEDRDDLPITGIPSAMNSLSGTPCTTRPKLPTPPQSVFPGSIGRRARLGLRPGLRPGVAAGLALTAVQRAASVPASVLTGTLGALFAVAGGLSVKRPAFARVEVLRVRGATRDPRDATGTPATGTPATGQAPLDPFPPVSVIVPAYNEEAAIAATIASLLDTDYPGTVEVIVVDHGSLDRTAEIVDSITLPSVQLIRKAHGGEPGALDTGIAVARAEILVLVDARTVFQRDTIRRLVAPLADPHAGTVGGTVGGVPDGVFAGDTGVPRPAAAPRTGRRRRRLVLRTGSFTGVARREQSRSTIGYT